MLHTWQGVALTLLAAALLYSNRQHHHVEAKEDGQGVDAACSAMVPIHYGMTPQTSPPPYSVAFNADSYTPGNAVEVTLKACTSASFKGFMIQARRAVTGSDQTEALGSFTPVAGTQRTCTGRGLIHTSPDLKTTLTFNWNPPTSGQGPVQFWVTFVQKYDTVWAAAKSEVLRDGQIFTPPNPSTLTAATPFIASCSSNPASSGEVTVPSGCGVDKGCIYKCPDSSCEMAISWEDNGNSVLYTISSQVASPTSYVALGFSSDQQMGGDSVTGCASAPDGSVVLFNAENTGKTPTLFADNGVTLQQSSFVNNVLSCTFERPKIASGKRFDVSQKWILLFATKDATFTGQTLSSLGYHMQDKFFTSDKYSSDDKPDLNLSPVSGPSTEPPVSGEVKVPSGCGTDKGCIAKCSTATSCQTVISWKETANSVLYTITSEVSPGTPYVALGFSSDQQMGDDDVIGCASASDGTVVMFLAQNTGKQPPDLSAPNNAITLQQSSLENNVLSCTIEMPKAATGQYDVTQKWIYLFATSTATFTGQTLNSLGYHKTNKFFSSEKYSALDKPDVNINPGPATDPPVTGSLTKPTECGTSVGCFSRCEGSACEFIVTWKDDGDAAVYTITSTVPSAPSYATIAFSSDDKMGGDSVTGCAASSSGDVVVFIGETTGKVRPKLFIDSDVTLTQSKMSDNVLSCTFKRVRAASADGKRFDLNKKWNILYAKGTATVNGQDVTLNYHAANKYFTSAKYSSSDLVDIGAPDVDYPKIKAHGSLMIAAWIFFASLGIVAARYYKPVWKDELCSQKVWFQIHRTCMVLVFGTTVAGFILIFLEVEDWSELIEDHEHLEYHPHMGVVVTALTVLNPLMAFFRPHPNTPNRPIFNWAHWFVGTAAHILAVITIFFGVQLQKAQVPDYMVYILAGYAGWQVLISLVLEVMQCCGKEKARQEVYEMNDMHGQKVESKESAKTLSTKRVILFMHVFVLAAVTSVLIGFVIVGEDDL